MVKSSFLTTDWKLVRRTCEMGDHSREALQLICSQYRYPLYAHARRCGCQPDLAEDVTQAFLLRLCETSLLAKADQAVGRLRTFLLASFNNFLISERRREQ